jgi:hypothetical protein
MYDLSVKFNEPRKKVDPTEVRYAEPEEYAAIMKLCRQLHKENGAFSMDEEKVSLMVERAVARKEGVMAVIGHIGEIEGMLLLRPSQYWYTSDWHLEELFSFVPPKYRKSNNAKKLVTWAMRAADSMGVPLFIGVVSTHRTEAKVRLYRRMLGTWVGCFFMHGGKFRDTAGNGATEH